MIGLPAGNLMPSITVSWGIIRHEAGATGRIRNVSLNTQCTYSSLFTSSHVRSSLSPRTSSTSSLILKRSKEFGDVKRKCSVICIVMWWLASRHFIGWIESFDTEVFTRSPVSVRPVWKSSLDKKFLCSRFLWLSDEFSLNVLVPNISTMYYTRSYVGAWVFEDAHGYKLGQILGSKIVVMSHMWSFFALVNVD